MRHLVWKETLMKSALEYLLSQLSRLNISAKCDVLRNNANEDRYVRKTNQKNQESTEAPDRYQPRRADPERQQRNIDDRGIGQNESTQTQPKMTVQNQVYKPTQHLLAWEEPEPVQNRPNTRQRNGIINHIIFGLSCLERQGQSPNRSYDIVQENDDRMRGGFRKGAQQQHHQQQSQPVASGSQAVFGKEHTSPKEMKEVKSIENELMSLQMRRDNV